MAGGTSARRRALAKRPQECRRGRGSPDAEGATAEGCSQRPRGGSGSEGEQGYMLHVTSYTLQATRYKLHGADTLVYNLHATSYTLPATRYQLHATSYTPPARLSVPLLRLLFLF